MRFYTKFHMDDKNKKLDLQINKSISIFLKFIDTVEVFSTCVESKYI